MADLRNTLAKARDTWFDSEEGQRATAGTASGQYLRNRLEYAFIAGSNILNDKGKAAINMCDKMKGLVANGRHYMAGPDILENLSKEWDETNER